MPKIIYTKTDEAPALATYSLLPIVRAFAATAGIDIQLSDISLAGRILANFSDHLPPDQRVPDALAELGTLTADRTANIIKLPNISASVPQLKAAIAELQAKGYALPDYPDDPKTAAQKQTHATYQKVLGSAVNPVLRQGNSDRRAPPAVKNHARKNPHKMGEWDPYSRTHVAHMHTGDFFSSERSETVRHDTQAHIEFHGHDGSHQLLADSFPLEAGDLIDTARLSRAPLYQFLDEQLTVARRSNLLWSLHLKATMMKVSDPIIFGHAVRVFYQDLFAKHAPLFEKLDIDPNLGMGDLHSKIAALPDTQRQEIEADIKECQRNRPPLAMVDSDKGITNLHVPSDIIVDASMPAMIRAGGKMWGPDGQLHDTLAVIPDQTYARMYQEVIDFCKENGAFDPATLGSVDNIGLMAGKAEEYGSHDWTFEMPAAGIVRLTTDYGSLGMSHTVEAGDIWRMCRTKDAAIRDWVNLTVERTRTSQTPAIFWLEESRAHDSQLIDRVQSYLAEHSSTGLWIDIRPPTYAVQDTMKRMVAGRDTIAVTGNVLRDYVTDLFPIIELGTSAKMLSIVPLMAGGGLFETGAGGSAPKHARQFIDEGHLRWDSLGEFLALSASLQKAAAGYKGEPRAAILAAALDQATEKLLEAGQSPQRKVGQPDNRSSHVHLCRHWAQALADQDQDPDLQAAFAPLAKTLAAKEAQILAEIDATQGQPVDLGGYYYPDPAKATAAMCPSPTFTAALSTLTPPGQAA